MLLVWPKTWVRGLGRPQLVVPSLSSFTTTLRARVPYPGSPHPKHHCKTGTSRATNIPCFLPCHLMSSAHWKTLSKPLDKQVLWDVSAKFRFWPLASSLFAAKLFCQTPEDTLTFLFPCLLAHWQGTPEGLWLLLWFSWWGWNMLFIWLIRSKHCAGQAERLIICYPSDYTKTPRFTPPWIKNQKTVNNFNTVSTLYTNVQVANFQRCECECRPLYTSCCTVLLCFSVYCAIRLKMFLIFSVCFLCTCDLYEKYYKPIMIWTYYTHNV